MTAAFLTSFAIAAVPFFGLPVAYAFGYLGFVRVASPKYTNRVGMVLPLTVRVCLFALALW